MKKKKKEVRIGLMVFLLFATILLIYADITHADIGTLLNPWKWFTNSSSSSDEVIRIPYEPDSTTPTANITPTPTETPKPTPIPKPTKSDYEKQLEEWDRQKKESDKAVADGLRERIKQIDSEISKIEVSIATENNYYNAMLDAMSKMWDVPSAKQSIQYNLTSSQLRKNHYEDQIRQLEAEKSQIQIEILKY